MKKDCVILFLLFLNMSVLLAESSDISFFEEDCRAGDDEACSHLGTLYLEGTSVKKNVDLAVEYLKYACQIKEFNCARLGLIYADGKDIKQDYNQAAELYQRSCNEGNSNGCGLLANIYIYGKGVPKDEKKGADYLKKACDMGNDIACTDLANLSSEYEEYHKKACEINPNSESCESSEEGIPDPETSCAKGNAAACLFLDGQKFFYGKGVSVNKERAAVLFKKSCRMGYMIGCLVSGNLYYTGIGVSPDTQKATLYYMKIIENKSVLMTDILSLLMAIHELSNDVSEIQNTRDAEKYYSLGKDALNIDAGVGRIFDPAAWESSTILLSYYSGAFLLNTACKLGYNKACDDFNNLLNNIRETCTPQDGYNSYYADYIEWSLNDIDRLEEFQKHCKDGISGACFSAYKSIGEKLEKSNNLEKEFAEKTQITLLDYGCNNWNGESCFELGFLYQDGDKVPKDNNKAAQYYKKGCENEDFKSCAEYSSLLFSEENITKDVVEKAMSLSTFACDFGVGVACNNLGTLFYAGKKEEDKKAALEMFNKACSFGWPSGCMNSANMYLNGEGAPFNKSEALKYYKKACDLDNEAGCTKANELKPEQEDKEVLLSISKTQRQNCAIGKREECKIIFDMYDVPCRNGDKRYCEGYDLIGQDLKSVRKFCQSQISSPSSQQESDDQVQSFSENSQRGTQSYSFDSYKYMHHIDLHASFPALVFYSESILDDFTSVDSDMSPVFAQLGYAFSFSFDTNSIHIAKWLYLLSGFSIRVNMAFVDFNIDEDTKINFYKANLMQGIKISPVKWFYLTLYWNPYVSIANMAFDPKGAGVNLGFVVGGPFLIGTKAYFFHDSNADLYVNGIDLNIGFSFLID